MFDASTIKRLLERVAGGELSVEDAVGLLRAMPFEDLGFAKVDSHRSLRKGFAEVIFCEGKTAAQVAAIVAKLNGLSERILGTRATPEHYEAARAEVEGLQYDAVARMLWFDREPDRPQQDGVVVVAAGTSDLPVAQEAARTLTVMGHAPRTICDVGVAGLHRLLHHVSELQKANVIIAVAGMEGALPSVVAGLVSAPVIAVPTSVGYGANFGGVAALLA
ncbi:MAG: nickel pincer cofactor biosynthesis protein LarB, partial [Phycisphaerales bacterium]